MSKKILLKRSNQKESNGQPKLPLSSQIDYGELAINYAKDAETLAIKNSENEIVTFNKINIVQTSGSSASNVMSQNAVTTELNKKANKATTLAGYGITDAKIEDGSITIGKETIKPLTSVPSEYVTDDELSAKGYQTASQVSSAISNLVDSAPETLNTLNELAAALGDDPNFATTITNQIAQKADASDLDKYATTEALTSGLAGKANTSHTHSAAQISGLTANRALVSNSSGVLSSSAITSTELGYLDGVTSNIQTQLNNKASLNHTHTIANITNLQTTLNGKANTSHTHTIANITDLQDTLDNKADTSDLDNYATTAALTSGLAGKANTSHTHTIANITNLQNTLNGKANTSHTHTTSQITDLSTTLSDYATTEALTSGLAGKANTSHTHTVAQINGLSQNKLMVSDASGRPSVLSVTSTEASYLSGVTSGIQMQLNGKAATGHGHNAAQIAGLTPKRALVSDGSGIVSSSNITDAELGYLDGVSSNIQTQLNGKADASELDNYATTAALTSGLAGKANTSHTHTIANLSNLGTDWADKLTQVLPEILKRDGTVPCFDVTNGDALTVPIFNSTGHLESSDITTLELGYLRNATGNIQTQLNGKANTSHTHTIANITNLQTTLNGKANTLHTHSAAQISGLTANRALVSDSSGILSSSAITSTDLESMMNYYKFIHSAQNIQSGSTLTIPATNFNHLYQWTLPDVSTALLIVLPGDWFSNYDAMADYYGWDIVIMINNSNTSSKTISFNTMNPNIDANLIRVSDTFTVESKAQMYITLRFGNRFMFVEYNNQKKSLLM